MATEIGSSPTRLFQGKEKKKPDVSEGQGKPALHSSQEHASKGVPSSKTSADSQNGKNPISTEQNGATKDSAKKVGHAQDREEVDDEGVDTAANTPVPTGGEPGLTGPSTQFEHNSAGSPVAASPRLPQSSTSPLTPVDQHRVSSSVAPSSGSQADMNTPIDDSRGSSTSPPTQVDQHSASSSVAPSPQPTEMNASQPIPSDSSPPVQEEGDSCSSPTETGQQSVQAGSLTVKVIAEDENFLESLARRLDAPHRVIKNHQHLACTLGVPADVRARCKRNTTYSPTKQVLELLEAQRPDLTVAEFINTLKNIGRKDVVNTMEKMLPDVAGKSCEKIKMEADLVAAIATKLDPVSQVNKYWLHFGLEVGLEKDDLEDIKSGTDPTLRLMEFIYTEKPQIKVGDFTKLMEDFKRNDVLADLPDLGDQDKLMTQAIPLDSDLMAKICRKLNKAVRGLKDWKAVASALKVPREVYKDFNPDKPQSPTKILFEFLSAKRPDLTVEKLRNALADIQRNDVVLLLNDKLSLS